MSTVRNKKLTSKELNEELGEIANDLRKERETPEEKRRIEEEIKSISEDTLPRIDGLKVVIEALQKLMKNSERDAYPEALFDKYALVLNKLTIGNDSKGSTYQMLQELYKPFPLQTLENLYQNLREKLIKIKIRLPENISTLNNLRYWLGMFKYMRKNPDVYARLQYVITMGDGEKIEKEWNRVYKDTPLAGKYREFALATRFFYQTFFVTTGVKPEDAEDITRVKEIIGLF